MKKDCDARELALALVERSPCNIQMAAVLSDKHGIFAWGWNHPGKISRGVHAEEFAVHRANKTRVRGATLTVAGKRTENDKLVYSRPCEHRRHGGVPCMELAKAFGIARIEYITKSGTWETLELQYVPIKKKRKK